MMGKYFWENEPESDDLNESKSKTAQSDPNQTLKNKIESTSLLIDQCDHKYQQFFTGYEKRPPIDLRKRLEKLMEQITKEPKSTPSLKFLYQSLHSKMVTYREKWDRLLKKSELS